MAKALRAEPKPRMSWSKRTVWQGVAGILDLAMFISTFLFFVIGPTLFGLAVAEKVGGVTNETIGNAAGVVAAGVTGVTAPEIYELLGIILAMCIGFMGSLGFVLTTMATTGVSMFRKSSVKRGLIIFRTFLLSVTPIGNATTIPFSSGVWSMASAIKKEDEEDRKKWEQERAEHFAQLKQANDMYAALTEQAEERETTEAEAEYLGSLEAANDHGSNVGNEGNNTPRGGEAPGIFEGYQEEAANDPEVQKILRPTG